MIWGIVLTCVLVALAGLWAAWRRQLNVTSPLAHFLAIYTFMFVVKPLQTVLSGDWTQLDQAIGTRDDGFIFLIFLAANLGLAAFVLGYAAGPGRRLAARLRLPEWPGDTRVMVAVGIATIVLSLLSFVRYHPTPLAPSYQTSQVGGRFVTTAYVALFSTEMWGIALLWLTGLRRRLWGWLVAGVFSLLVLYGGWHRWMVFTLFVGVLITERLARRLPPIRAWLFTAALALPTLWVFARLAEDRAYVQRVWQGEIPWWETGEGRPLIDWSYFGSIEPLGLYLQTIPSVRGFAWGGGYLNAALLPIPRQVWRGKRDIFATGQLLDPAVSPTYMVEHLGRGATVSMFAEFYGEFGWIGILVGMSLFGTICRLAYEVAIRHRANPYVRVLYAAGLSYLVFSVHHGHFQTLISYAMVAAGVVLCGVVEWWGWYRFGAARAPAHQPQHAQAASG